MSWFTQSLKMADSHISKNLIRLSPEASVLLVCDMQERFRSVIHNFPATLASTNKLVRAASVLDIPMVVTEQYPEKLLRTVRELNISHGKLFEKTRFSMITDEVKAHMLNEVGGDRRDVIICGIEAHVCVQQTVLDLILLGYNVCVAADAVSSSNAERSQLAIHRMMQAGAAVASTESIMFELLKDAKHPKFKEISAIVKDDSLPMEQKSSKV